MHVSEPKANTEHLLWCVCR